MAAPHYGASAGWDEAGRSSRQVVAGPVALLVQQLRLISSHHQAPAPGEEHRSEQAVKESGDGAGGHAGKGASPTGGPHCWVPTPARGAGHPSPAHKQPRRALAADQQHRQLLPAFAPPSSNSHPLGRGRWGPLGLSQICGDKALGRNASTMAQCRSRHLGGNGGTHGICSSTVSTPCGGLAPPGVKAL